jgi:hypothetical protein
VGKGHRRDHARRGLRPRHRGTGRGHANARDKVFTLRATPGSPSYGLVQNKYLLQRAEIKDFVTTFKVHGDGTFSYESDLLLQLAATDGEMHHTDRNTLHRVK